MSNIERGPDDTSEMTSPAGEKEMNHGSSNETDLYFFDDVAGTGDDNSSDQGTAEWNPEEFYSSSGLSSADIEFSLVDADIEEDNRGSRWADPEFAKTAFSGLPDPRKGTGRTADQPLTRVTEEDFPPGPQRKAFILVRHFANSFCQKKTESLDRLIAARWLFCVPEAKSASFELCTTVLNSRADVIRMRFMYELWSRWIIFADPMPTTVVPVPPVLFDEIQFCAGTAGHMIAQEAWEWPGIPTEQLLLRASGRNSLDEVPLAYSVALHELGARFILSPKEDRWWMTGRNPFLAAQEGQITHSQPVIRGKTVTFSELFN